MEVNHFSSLHDSNIDNLLSQPQLLLPLLFDSCQYDLLVYTHDMERRLTYLSDSSWNVCKLDFRNWRKKSFLPMFTDHPWNDHYRSRMDSEILPQEIQQLKCEIWNDEGAKEQLDVWRRLVIYEDAPIGVIGVSKRMSSISPPINHQRPFDLITPAEMSVIRLVVDGTLNKSIAVKLGIAIRTVEMRRSKAMHKLGVRSVSELVRLWCQFSMDKSTATASAEPLASNSTHPKTPD